MGLLVAAVTSGPNWTPPPTIPIKKLHGQEVGETRGTLIAYDETEKMEIFCLYDVECDPNS
jgi:hypothetical protein